VSATRGTVALWPADLREEWDERAALVQDGCRVSREESERIAYEQLRHRAPMRQADLGMTDNGRGR
jgi:hypothetical protein